MCCAATAPTAVKSPPANKNDVAAVVPLRAARQFSRASNDAGLLSLHRLPATCDDPSDDRRGDPEDEAHEEPGAGPLAQALAHAQLIDSGERLPPKYLPVSCR